MEKPMVLVAVVLVSCEATKAPNKTNEEAKVGGTQQRLLPPIRDIHDYADQCMCELGGRAGRGGRPYRMPQDISPNTADEVEVFWAERVISWDGTRFLFDGAVDPPEGGGGPIIDFRDLRCDYAPFVERTCLPGSRYYEQEVDGVQWTSVMRRSGPSTPGAGWGETHPAYYKVVDVSAYKADTGAVCWFDSLNAAPNGPQSETNGFLVGPIPRPGGRNTESANGRRALAWHDTADQMRGQPCTGCHGNGPILGSDWVHQGSFTGRPQDDMVPYWNTAQLFDDPVFFKFAVVDGGRDRCSTCHNYWEAGATTTPGGFIGNEMSSRPTDATVFSQFRREANQARRTHVMPPPSDSVPNNDADWNDAFRPSLDGLAFCSSTPFDPACNGAVQAQPPTFWSDPEPQPADPQQKIEPPDEAINIAVQTVECPPNVPHPADDNTCYEISWEDPTDEWTAPTSYLFHFADPASDAEYCASGASDPYDTQPIPDSEWRNRYTVTKYLEPCACAWVRICGAWCNYPPRIQPVKTPGVKTVIERQCN